MALKKYYIYITENNPEKLPTEEIAVPEKPKAKNQPQEKRYVKRAWADKYAKSIGGQVLEQVDEDDKKIYVVVPPESQYI